MIISKVVRRGGDKGVIGTSLLFLYLVLVLVLGQISDTINIIYHIQ